MTIFGKIRPVGAGATAILSLMLALLVAGCSSGTGAGLGLVDSQGNHPASFMSAHPSFAVSNVEQCKPCHGDDLTGGIAKISCFTAACHHGTIPGWSNSGSHGAAAKRAPGNSGFKSCQICHASDFTGDGSGIACSDCHGVPAPHPAAPWRAAANPTHTNTDPANAPVCAACHFPGSANNPANHPAAPAPSGTPPDCFNNTLCHGLAAAPHAVGTAWLDPAVGGANFHGLAAKQDLAFCQTCHGTPNTIRFNGGSAPTSCSSAGCHPSARAHPIPWYQAPQSFPNYVASHRNSGNRSVACAICHKVDGVGSGPDPAAPSCFSSSFGGNSCHANGPGNANHNVPYLETGHTAVSPSGFASNCANCHAETGISPLASAPLCTVCHQSGTPLANFNCTSCHAAPPDGPTATAPYPNIAGRHAKHNALTGVTDLCVTCHSGLDSGSLNHYNRANARPGFDALRQEPGDAAFLSAYNGNQGPASFDDLALTCSNVSCHGGLPAPNWRTGTINVTTDAGCRQCHALGTAAGTPENNSPYSGLHAFHLGSTVNALCTECHDMGNGSAGALNHFTSLNTPQMEGPPGQTLTFPGLTGATYDSGTQNCTLTCHGQTHTGFSWSGGANHNVPFLETAHTTASSSTFASTCGGCHFETGATDKIGPTCTVCHQSGTPLANFNCTSCHSDPPSGSAYPDIAGRHAGHVALNTAGTPVSCVTCHTGLDSGSQAHYDRANARPGLDALRQPPGDAVFSAYSARSGAISFNATAFTCSNASCHGGQTTPSWRTGTINVNTQCTSCHQQGSGPGVPQYNVYWSGRHSIGQHVNAGCTACHNTTKLADPAVGGHFLNLSTTALDVRGSVTIAGGSTRVVSYTPGGTVGTGTCTPQSNVGCHGSETWN